MGRKRHTIHRFRGVPAAVPGLILVTVMLLSASCLKDAPESLPETIEWNPELAFPLGEDNYDLFNVPGFDSTKIDLDTVTGLPEWVEPGIPVVMEGELDIDLTAIMANIEQINGILFRVNFENGFPDEIFAQGYFRDNGGPDLDSMFRDGPVPVPPARIRQDGTLISPGKAQEDAYFDRARIVALESATTLYLKAFFVVTDPDSALIPHYPEFQLSVQLGAMFDLSLEF